MSSYNDIMEKLSADHEMRSRVLGGIERELAIGDARDDGLDDLVAPAIGSATASSPAFTRAPKAKRLRFVRMLIPAACAALLAFGIFTATTKGVDLPGSLAVQQASENSAAAEPSTEKPLSADQSATHGQTQSQTPTQTESAAAATHSEGAQPRNDGVDANSQDAAYGPSADSVGYNAVTDGRNPAEGNQEQPPATPPFNDPDAAPAIGPGTEPPNSVATDPADEQDGDKPSEGESPSGDDNPQKPAALSLEGASVAGVSGAVFSGSAIALLPTVSMNGTPLENGIDYTLNFCNADGEEVPADGIVNAGTYSAIIEGAGSYTGTLTIPFAVSPAPIEGASIDDMAANGSALEPTVRWNGISLAEGVDFLMQIMDAEGSAIDGASVQESGNYTALISGIGNYCGETAVSFSVL